jgi:hypothetical protein
MRLLLALLVCELVFERLVVLAQPLRSVDAAVDRAKLLLKLVLFSNFTLAS